MAWLTHIATGKRQVLSPVHLVGRSHACALRLLERRVSGEHASFRWSGEGWTLRDLHSSNGTFVDQHRLAPGEAVLLHAGARIGFGDEGGVFELSSDSPPVAVARGPEGPPLYAEEGVLCVPGPENADYLIFEDDPGRWFVEARDGSCQRIHDQDELHCKGQVWRVELPLMWERTARADEAVLRVADIGLRLRVSRNEEYVEMAIQHRGQEIALQPRAHGYLLATLARLRLRDREQPDLPEADQGWVYVSELMRMLDTSETMLNVDIHRARAQLRAAKVLDAAKLIERRRVSREIRLGVRAIEIYP